MNKLNIVTTLMVIISAILVSCLTIVDGIFDTMIFLISSIIAFSFAMLYKKNKIKKARILYNIILFILGLISSSFIIFFIYTSISCLISYDCYNNTSANLEFILMSVLFTFTLIQIIDIKTEKNRIHHILTWIVSIIVIIIYLRYNYDISFLHNYIYQNQYEIQNSYIYITQNYIYLVILYVSLLIHYFINKK